jgi:hypothetical protein
MDRKCRMFAVAGGVHTEVETGKGTDANIIRRSTSWMLGAFSRISRMPTDAV